MAHSGWEGTFATDPDNVSVARRAVRSWVRALMPDAEVMAGDIELAVSEACTNVVMHAYPTGDEGDFHVSAALEGERVRVVVRDVGVGLAPRPDSGGVGLGLPVMASVTDELVLRAPDDGPGTVVEMWFA